MKLKITFLALSIAATPAFAKLADEQGISGEISLNAGITSSTSNFNTDGDNNITSTDKKASSESSFLVAPLGSVAYTFGERLNHQVYTGTARDDIATGTAVLEVGYKYQLQSGMVIDASILPTIMSGETWADPYNTTGPRSKTDEKGHAFRLKLSSIAGSPFSLDMAYATKDVEQDNVPDELKRDADTFYVKGQYRQPLSRSLMLVPSIIYQSRDADGSAESYDQLGAEVSLFGSVGRHKYALTAGYNQRDYDAGSSLFNNTVRSDDNINLFAAYEYDKFMNWDNWSFISLAGYGTSNSNITFYDESQYIVSVGMNYKF